MRIAIDAMGGDKAPDPIVIGAARAVQADHGLTILLVGDRERVEACLPADAPRDRIEFVQCSQTIGMDESPAEAMRARPDNSISRCWQLLAEKKADAIVGAGSTGAMVAGGLMSRRFLKGIKRPGIATLMPTAKGPCVVVDVGANIHPRPIHLVQYAAMGATFARHVLGRETPTVGLMNVGEEGGKGTSLTKSVFDMLQSPNLPGKFLGNIEGRDIHAGKCDVVVCDGFTGNVILKLSEGVFDFVMNTVKREVVGPLPVDAQAQAGGALKAIFQRYDYSSFGGAPLLGIDGICIICHGSSGEVAIENAIKLAAQYARVELNDKFVEAVAAMPADAE